jgi:hypothetical protein
MNKGLNRNNGEKYMTKREIANLCIDYVRKNIVIKESDLIIEPSAGNGAFIEGISTFCCNQMFMDIEPDNDVISEYDYLNFNHKEINYEGVIHVIGNPPFGRQSSLAIKFIKKSCEFCDSLSFILPKSFKKESMKKAFPLNFHLIFETDLPSESFLLDDVSYDVPCVFQIWVKKEINREQVQKIEPLSFVFVKQTENPDISFRRVGVNAGVISADIDKSIESHYFIRFTNDKSLKEFLKMDYLD